MKQDAKVPGPLTPAVFHILLALSDGPLHGYGIMRAVEESAESAQRMGPGTVYGSIQRMEEAGLVEEIPGAAGGKRRVFGLTGEGRKALEVESARLTRLSDMVRAKGLAPRGA
jgi:DNA-binding PadR family transcriptional regulator